MGRIKITGDYRICKTCGIKKHISEYNLRNRSKQQYCCHCKECLHKKYKEINKEKYKNDEGFRQRRIENSRRYRINHPDECRKTNLKCKYGITIDDIENMDRNQEGKCAICGEHKNNLSRGLVVDHNHNTGEIRGLLCDTCNKFLGFYERRGDKCKEYLLKPPYK